jgi:hypothetical protein
LLLKSMYGNVVAALKSFRLTRDIYLKWWGTSKA